MDLEAFTAALKRDGYSDIAERSQPPHQTNAAHSHPFDVQAIVLQGELRLTFEGRTQVCRAGDIFTMAAGCVHEEAFGAEGAQYLVGRRTPAVA
ncbi:MAG: cupin domain-containing protein [Burkholderiales bacterium]